MKKQIFLIGYMGCGKSTLGIALARSLGWSFVDLDEAFEQTHRCTISAYFKNHGEDGFRKAEHDLLISSLEVENRVYATGGGLPCFFNNMALMNDSGLTIYIKLPAQALCRRLAGGKHHRPLIADKSDSELLEFIDIKLKEREPFYNQAKLIVEDSGTLSVQGYVNIIRSAKELNSLDSLTA